MSNTENTPFGATADGITVLTALRPMRMAKVWKADGSIAPYDRAQRFKHRQVAVANIQELSALLTQLETDPHSCIVRGRYDGDEPVIPRRKVVLQDQLLHTVLVDVDKFEPLTADPVAEPEAAVWEFISTMLPEPFRGASYHWQLSNSAGHPDKPGLRAHIWFWLAQPATSAQLRAWAKRTGFAGDKALFDSIQVHYTAAPVFEGLPDPCPLRSGFALGLCSDEVELDLDEGDLQAVERAVDLERERDLGDIADPTVAWLAEQWEVRGIDGQGRVHVRCPWDHEHSNAGAADDTSSTYLPAGVGKDEAGYKCLHEHCSGRGLFDFLRAVGLDRPEDDFQVVEAVPEVDAKRELRNGLLATFTAEIEQTQDILDLEEKIGQRIGRSLQLSDTQREILANKIKARCKVLGAPIPIGDIRQWVAPRAMGGGFPDLGESGEVKATLENFRYLMRRLGIVLRYNVIRKDVDILLPRVSLSQDNRDNAARAYILSECERAGMSTKHVDHYLLAVADENPYNPVLSWIESREWDGVDRLQALYDTVISEAPHKEMVMRKWLISAVAAAVSPEGISAQGVLTFQGAQNKGKSTWFKRLVPSGCDFFKGEYALKVQDKDSVLTAMGYWIVELGELDATFSKSEISNLKNFITNNADKLRRPYAARDSYLPRRTVLCATVNPAEFLRDPTGNRRFWCVPVKGFVQDHQVNMQQLWAQVYELVKAGEGWSLDRDELDTVNRANERFVEVSPWRERLAVNFAWDSDRSGWSRLASVQVAAQCGVQRPTSGDCREIVSALRALSGEPVAHHAGVSKWLVPPCVMNAQDFA